MHKEGKLVLVGAGPGDPELLTLKGLQAIQTADVILYDALVNTTLLAHNNNAKKVFVGKRKGHHSYNQTEINTLAVGFAKEGHKVVRLKGGDVGIFARSAEEVEYAQLMGVETEMIPGISSYSGIAATHQIPLTRRCAYESLWITTGHTCDGSISEDIALAAQSTATVVVFMGMSHLKEIINTFKTHKPDHYPVAIIQNGTLPNERHIVSDLKNVVQDVADAELGSPALIILGNAVKDGVCKLMKHLKEKEEVL